MSAADLAKMFARSNAMPLILAIAIASVLPVLSMIIVIALLALSARGLAAHRRFTPRAVESLDGRTGTAIGLWNRDVMVFNADDARRYLVRWDDGGTDTQWYSDRPIHANGRAALAPIAD